MIDRPHADELRQEEIAALKDEREGYIEEVKKWRARGNEEEERRAFRECERINRRLTELDYYDVAVEVYIELPVMEVEG